jgi:5,10-methylenetetrahydrofolate reductase
MSNDSDLIDCRSKTPVLFEIVPPAKGKRQKRLESHKKNIRQLFNEADVHGLNLPEIQDESKKGEKGRRTTPFKERVSPRRYTRNLSETFETNYVINHVCVNHSSAAELENWLLSTYETFNISHVILVGGESSQNNYNGPSVCDANKLVKNYLNRGQLCYQNDAISPTNFTIGNICIPTRRRDVYDEPARMFNKFDAGADFFTSQIITETEKPISLMQDFSRLLEENEVENPPAIFWSLSPISSKKDIDFLRWLGVYIPENTEKRILGSKHPAEASLDIALELFEKLNDFNRQLSVSIPTGMNISVMGLRNFENGIRLAKQMDMAGVGG